jgi:hypothetical protein
MNVLIISSLTRKESKLNGSLTFASIDAPDQNQMSKLNKLRTDLDIISYS